MIGRPSMSTNGLTVSLELPVVEADEIAAARFVRTTRPPSGLRAELARIVDETLERLRPGEWRGSVVLVSAHRTLRLEHDAHAVDDGQSRKSRSFGQRETHRI